jgi:hypothetical protein
MVGRRPFAAAALRVPAAPDAPENVSLDGGIQFSLDGAQAARNVADETDGSELFS